MSHVEPERGGNRDQIGLGIRREANDEEIERLNGIIENLHRILGQKRKLIRELREELKKKKL